MSKFVEVEWLSAMNTVGYVLTYDEHDGFKVRSDWAGIDTGHFDESEDIRAIMEMGAKVPFEWAWAIFGARMIAYVEDLVGDTPGAIRYDRQVYNLSKLPKLFNRAAMEVKS